MGIDYRQSGVDIDAGNEVVRRVRDLARSTFTRGVLTEIGSFGGVYALDPDRDDVPLLVASADGVGTKLKVAVMANRHDTVGEDLVNHCVNDILVQGARPLFFLDYLAMGRLLPDVAVAVIGGIARACRANGCALLGGETAEMPGLYADGDYDLAGFIVGSVGRGRLVDGRRLVAGDVLIGLPSSGLHTNGYSLARRVLFTELGWQVDTFIEAVGRTVGEALLVPHRSYLAPVLPLVERGLVRGLAHITGGGLTENVPRMLPPGLAARIDRRAWTVPALFRVIEQGGRVPASDMWRTFNMGIGLVVACGRADAPEVLARLADGGETGAVVMGDLVEGDREVHYVG